MSGMELTTSESDNELLALAAKVVGAVELPPGRTASRFGACKSITSKWTLAGEMWAPLEDDSHAMRLAIIIGADIIRLRHVVHVNAIGPGIGLKHHSEWFEDGSIEGRAAAERRAYVILASKIEGTMPDAIDDKVLAHLRSIHGSTAHAMQGDIGVGRVHISAACQRLKRKGLVQTSPDLKTYWQAVKP